MKKIIFFLLTFGLIWSNARPVSAAVSLVATDNGAPGVNIYRSEFDQLVLDINISRSDSIADTLQALTIRNTGSAGISTIYKLTFWADAGQAGFQGMEVDTKLGEAVWNDTNNYWYLSGLSQAVPTTGLRLFASIETPTSISANTLVQMEIPTLLDSNANGQFEVGDQGIFLAGIAGPAAVVTNNYIQTINSYPQDIVGPKTVITDPLAGATITSSSYTIRGASRDQAGSSTMSVKISINDGAWQEVTPIGSNYLTWEYAWANIANGTYNIKTESEDWLSNKATSSSVAVTVNIPAAIVTPTPVTGIQPIDNLQFGDLIKASQATIYYYGSNGKRYVFPNEKTYMTWYSDFSGVKTISDSELASISLIGNVTYKPGVKMVKITTDPKVYAVSAGGTLRWVQTEAIASALYGANWSAMVEDVPDSFFVNYIVGTAIESAAAFNVAEVTAAAKDINTDKESLARPTP